MHVRRYLVSALLATLATACKEQRERPLQAEPAPVATPEPLAPPPLLEETFAIAVFSNENNLDQCLDVVVSTERSLDPAIRQGITDRLVSSISKGRKKGTVAKLQRECSDQFKGNPALASCSGSAVPHNDGGLIVGAKIAFQGHYYDLDELEKSDSFMKECLEGNGDWQAVDHDSEAWRDAHMTRARRELEKLQKSLR
jgi:hypothetical protein